MEPYTLQWNTKQSWNDAIETGDGMKRHLQESRTDLGAYYKRLCSMINILKEFYEVYICKHSCTETRLEQ